ncbi:DUF6059 family protein [Streptomyces sp. NBC_00572]|uniref:DUF6059 family protein n=1 Tax=Streptomyces sp. NBC_00572 TaxID=2903664 RepID=UPI002259CCF7|nr:DUF6059 family protein [Streptomyces sp. NBC_00572]MCX4984941.1 hypothetical protein [Streptomyces sp. NBC_00572]
MSTWKRHHAMGRLPALLSRCWRPVMRALVGYGSLWTPQVVPELLEPSWPPPSAAPVLMAEPPACHPERLTPDVPLSQVELSLQQRLYARGPER